VSLCGSACPACPVECEAYSSGVAPVDGTGMANIKKERSLPRETYLSFLFNWGGFNRGLIFQYVIYFLKCAINYLYFPVVE